MTIGVIGSLSKTIAISGSNCAIQGFDLNGQDSYWTVTGDNVTCMCICDLNQDGLNEAIKIYVFYYKNNVLIKFFSILVNNWFRWQ